MLYSNLEYIRLFRHASRLDGQEEYYLTQMLSAVEFIAKLSAETLKITPEEYHKHFHP
jgi:Vacuolar sorting protein 9 (VPS9) domain